MYKDETWKVVEEQVEGALETYSMEEILEMGELTIEEALIHLVLNGNLLLPEVKNVNLKE